MKTKRCPSCRKDIPSSSPIHTCYDAYEVQQKEIADLRQRLNRAEKACAEKELQLKVIQSRSYDGCMEDECLTCGAINEICCHPEAAIDYKIESNPRSIKAQVKPLVEALERIGFIDGQPDKSYLGRTAREALEQFKKGNG